MKNYINVAVSQIKVDQESQQNIKEISNLKLYELLDQFKDYIGSRPQLIKI